MDVKHLSRHGACLAAAVVLMSACGGAKIEEAKRLAIAGTEAGGMLQASAKAVQDGYSHAIRQDHFLVTLQEATIPPKTGCSLIGAKADPTATDPDTTLNASQVKILKVLKARATLAQSLTKTYAAFGALAQYDASGEIESGMAGVVDAANGLRAEVGLGALPGVAGTILKAGAGEIAQMVQLAKLRTASVELARILAGYREGLGVARVPVTSVLRVQLHRGAALNEALWRRGLVTAGPMVEEIARPTDMAFEANEKATLTAANDGLCRAVRVYLRAEGDRKADAATAEYDGQIEAVDALERLTKWRFGCWEGDGSSSSPRPSVVAHLAVAAAGEAGGEPRPSAGGQP